MKINFETADLDWNKATVRDYRYIHHLMMMIHERWTKLGMSPSGYAKINSFIPCSSLGYGQLAFNLCRYSPGGILTWDQLSSIYHAMLYLGIHAYFNEKNLDEKYWENGDNKKLYYFSLQDMCEIAEFDFFSHPFIPGQPIDYYSQFLFPIKKVLSAYKKVASMHFIMPNPTYSLTPFINGIYSWDSNPNGAFVPVPTKNIIGKDGVERTYRYEGGDLIDFFSNADNYINKIKEYYNFYKNGGEWKTANPQNVNTNCPPHLLGYEYTVTTKYETSNDYNRSDSYTIASGLVFNSYSVIFGNNFKCAELWPAGSTYDIYLCHTTYYPKNLIYSSSSENLVPKYFNSPWPMVFKAKTGTVPENNILETWIELPDWNLPKDYPFSVEGERYYEKWKYTSSGGVTTEYHPKYKTPGWTEDHYAAFYYPLVVVDVSKTFKYN